MSKSLTVQVLSIGKINIQSGKTQYDWSIYNNGTGFVFYVGGFLLYGAHQDDFEIGDQLTLRNNDTNRLAGRAVVADVAPAIKEDVIEMLLRHEYDYREAKAFKKKQFKRKLNTSYSVKGISLNN